MPYQPLQPNSANRINSANSLPICFLDFKRGERENNLPQREGKKEEEALTLERKKKRENIYLKEKERGRESIYYGKNKISTLNINKKKGMEKKLKKCK